MVTIVWETWLKAGNEDEGLEITRQIWTDMKRFEGYISHYILIDQDSKGHILVVSKWKTRELADKIKVEYSNSDTVRRITPLLQRTRNRWVFDEDII